MIKRINRTKRKRIEKGDAHIRVRPSENGAAPIFDADLRLDSYGFDANATVRVEAARSNAVQRWDFGTVGAITPPPDDERRLTDVPTGAAFRVFVVEAGGTGKLLGHAPRIRPVLPLESLLPLEESDELGDEVWRVDFGENGDDTPVLRVNRKIPGISEVVRTDAGFRALVMPEVLRTILTRVVLIDRVDAEEEGLAADWLTLAQNYDPEGREPPSLRPNANLDAEVQSAQKWIGEVVEAFAAEAVKAAPSYGDYVGARS